MKQNRYEVYEAKDGFRWRLIAKNGRIVSESGEAYARKSGAIKAVERHREIAVVAEGPDRSFDHLKAFESNAASLRAH